MKFLMILLLLLAQPLMAADFRSGEEVNVTGKLTQSLFVTGERIHANVESTDDIFMAGADITQIASSSENFFLAGGRIRVTNPKARLGVMAGGDLMITQASLRDVVAAGGRVRLDESNINDDLILAGGNVEIGKTARIDDTVVLAGSEIEFAGHAGGDAEITGQEVTITGTFAKNLTVRAERVIVGPDAEILGNFSHKTNNLQLSPDARIAGQNIKLEDTALATPGSLAKFWGFLAGLLFTAGVLLAPALIIQLFPRFVQGGSEMIRTSFWETMGKGTVSLIAVPLVLFLLFASVIGVPAGFFALPFLFVGILMAWSIVVLTAGKFLRWAFRKARKMETDSQMILRSEIFRWSLAGALGLLILLAVPVIGFFLCMILFIAGVGAIYMQMRGQAPRKRSAESRQTYDQLIPAGTLP